MGLKLAGARRVLSGGFFGSGIYIGLIDGSGNEFTSSGGYARITQTAINRWQEGSGGAYQNIDVLNFAPPNQVLAAPVEIGIWSAIINGDLLFTNDLDGDPAAPGIGSSYGFNSQQINIGFAGSGSALTEDGSHAGFEAGGLLGVNRWVSLHSAEPNDTGSNQAGSSIPIAPSGWSSSNNVYRNAAAINFGIQATNLPDIMWVALRTSNAANAPVLLKDQLDNNPDDPELGDTLVIPANGLSITVQIDA